MSHKINIEPPDSSQTGQLTADGEKTNNEYTTSGEKLIPKQPLVMIDYLSASYLSHRSSSVETLESPSIGDECTNFNPAVDNPHAMDNDDSSIDCTEEGKVSRIMIHSMEIMPDHQSTPNAEYQYMSSVAEGDNVLRKELSFNEGEDTAEKELLMPGDLAVPIMGYETMESRSRFTVYKIKVQKRDDPVGWFVFRRYSDFVHLNERLKHLFPGFRLSLPPKRWFRDNYDKNFLEDRVLGLQAFLNNITGHKDICNSLPVRGFLCIDDPPGPHDSLEESRALCETLEETLYTLRQDLQDKDSEINLLKEELQLYKSQVEMLSSRLREVTDSVMKGESIISQSSTSHSLAECDHHDAIPVPTQAGDNLSQNS